MSEDIIINNSGREDRKRIQTTKYVSALAITILVFVIGILIGNYISSSKLTIIEDTQQNIYFNTLGLDIKYELIKGSSCDEISLENEYFNEITDVGKRLAYLESQLGSNNKDVRKLKEYYHLLEMKHILLINSIENKCNVEFNNVIFFYAIDEICGECSEQGEILTFLYKKYPTFNVYSFDVNIDNPAIEALKTKYKINGNKDVPAIVYDDNVYIGYKNKNEIATIIFGDNETIMNEFGVD